VEKTKYRLVREAVIQVLTTVDETQVKAEVLYDLLKSELPDEKLNKGSFYSVLSRMADAGDIQRVSYGWYALPRRREPREERAGDSTLREELYELFLDKLALEAQKAHPDPRRIQLLVEMMREMIRC